MFKKAFESFFIIDANEKPAPSFLAAYLIAWFYVHKQVITTFISTTGAFDIRLNASIASITENLYMQAFGWAIVFVIIRFGLNNLIYFVRESFDHLTQFTLNKLNMKSFIKTTVHQSVLDDLANARGKLHSFHDRAILAEESQNKINNELKALKSDTDTQLQDAENNIKEKEIEIEGHIELSEKLSNQYTQSEVDIDDLNEKLRNLSSAHEQLKVRHDSLLEDRNNLNTELKESSKIRMNLKNEQKSLAYDFNELTKNYNNIKDKFTNKNKESANLIGQVEIMDQSASKLLARNEELASDLSSSDNFKKNINKQITKWADKTEQPELMLLGRDESKLNNDEKILLDKLLNSLILKKESLNTAQEVIEQVKLAGLADVDAASRAKKINEDFKLAGLADVNAASRAKKITEEIKLSGLGDVDATSYAEKIIEDINLAGLGDENLASRIKKITEEVNLAGLADANAISSEKDN